MRGWRYDGRLFYGLGFDAAIFQMVVQYRADKNIICSGDN